MVVLDDSEYSSIIYCCHYHPLQNQNVNENVQKFCYWQNFWKFVWLPSLPYFWGVKKKLLILSDLWGFDQATYLDLYLEKLRPHFDIQLYDSCILSGLTSDQQSQAERHRHFISGGIEIAVSRLIKAEKEATTALVFSVGGVIAWRAALAGLPIDRLVAISATRLRYEGSRPDWGLKLWYGELDPYQPNEEWRQRMNVLVHTSPGLGHDIYTRPSIIEQICPTALS